MTRYIPIILVVHDDSIADTIELLNEHVRFTSPIESVIFGAGDRTRRHPEEAIEAAFIFAETLEEVPKQ